MITKLIANIEERLGFRFSNRLLLVEAISHRSWSNRFGKDYDYERMEFLGDALLQREVSLKLYEEFPSAAPGELTFMRAALVSRENLCRVFNEWEFDRYILVEGSLKDEAGILKGDFGGDFLESLVAAVYFCSSGKEFSKFMQALYKNISAGCEFVDYKSKLQDFFLKCIKKTPVYDTIPITDGYMAVVSYQGFSAEGTGKTKKSAEQMAAKVLLKHIDNS